MNKDNEQREIGRVIKFRAIVPVNSDGPKSMHYFDLSKIDDCNRLSYADYDANALMQFTGYKDKSGTEIFEGDIMALKNSDETIRFEYVVKFEDAKFVLYHTKKEYGKWGDLYRIFDADFREYNFCVTGHIYSSEPEREPDQEWKNKSEPYL